MTLLDDYRRAVYSNQQQRAVDTTRSRRLTPLSSSRSRQAPEHNHVLVIPSPSSSSVRSKSQLRHRRVNAINNIKLQGLSSRKPNHPTPSSSSNQDDRDHIQTPEASEPSNRPSTSLQQTLDDIQTASSIATGSRRASLEELPSQFLQEPVIQISKWTVIVSDTTLFRIAAQNKRLHNTLAKRLTQRTTEKDLAKASITKAIIMNGADRITDRGLNAIAEHVPTLEVLEIAQAHLVSDAAIRAIAGKCVNLRKLNLSGCSGIRGAGLGALGEHCRHLTEFAIADCAQIGEWALLRCIYGFAQLQHVNFARCVQLSDHVVKTLAQQCGKRLQTLILSDCHQLTDVGLVAVAQHCRQLIKLVLNRSQATEKVTDTTCMAIGEHCTQLEELNVAGCNFMTDAGVKWIADGCRSLRMLDISQLFHVTDASLRVLGANCSLLTSLRLVNVQRVSDVGLRYVAIGCSALETLHVHHLYLVSDGRDRDFGLEGLQAIAQACRNLKDLQLVGCFQLVERALVALGTHCPTLETLNLKACPNITRAGIQALVAGCRNLVSLNLSGVTQCNNTVVQAIVRHCTQLRELWLVQCEKITDLGIKALSQRANAWELLDLSGCIQVSDTGLGYLLDAFHEPKLLHLFLVGCTQVSQDSIARLAFACPFLLTLSVHNCRVSARVLQSLSSSWPFATLRIPTSAAAGLSSVEMGFFPRPRAKDRRFVEETCAIWVAAVKIQNLFRARQARRRRAIQQEAATRLYVARRLQAMWRGRRARREVLLKKLMQSGLEKSAIKIQRRYRETRMARRHHERLQVILNQQLEYYVVIIQRRYRAKRSATLAYAIVRAKQKQKARETQAAIILQRRFRGVKDRKRFHLARIQRQAMQKEQAEASKRIQAIYRGRADRKKAREREQHKKLDQIKREVSALKIQAQYRRHLACKEVQRRRDKLRWRDHIVTKLQAKYRAHKSRQYVGMLQMTKIQTEWHRAAKIIQRRWRTRKDRMGLQILILMRHQRNMKREQAAIFIQQTIRRYLVRKRARKVMLELLQVHRHAIAIQHWAVTLVQSHWRRIMAQRAFQIMEWEHRTRWKQLIDTYNEHGKGYGAPFYYVRPWFSEHKDPEIQNIWSLDLEIWISGF